MAVNREICRASVRTSVVETKFAEDRFEAVYRKLSLKLRIRVTVVSDYLFIGSGRYRYVSEGTSGGYSVGRIRGAYQLKEFYRIAGKPAIPGSSLKGAVRSRIELGSSGEKVIATFLYDTGPLHALPERGMHGWRHTRIWCESVFELRSIDRGKGYSIVEDVFGYAGPEAPAIASRVYFGTLIGKNVRLEPLVLDHGEKLEAAPKGSVFEGEIVALGLSVEELGLLLYGLAQDKLLCGREPLMLLGASKYRCRTVTSAGGKKVEFGVVKVEVVSCNPAPWSRELFEKTFGSMSTRNIVRYAVEKALETYPGLRKCFDEVERRRLIEPCVSG